ncbi:uncharacterized protein LOC110011766 isoform X2 [Sesamum indicum]|uniref:Uncharacterized protein LOC110011766 isoform X2 n=1 Tax=Sesamum indicum TaxID=4182 RepID=A0A8M8UX86_SESIN|nr:uncharacterized protein LOC110011766 isoform X2 [Sesamum indicum]
MRVSPTLILLPLFFVSFLLLVSIHAKEDVCANVDCVKGTCVPYNSSILGFDCECYSGWKKVQIGPITFPTCVIPNCTLKLQCGNGAPPSPPPPAAAPPPFNLLSPCNLVWCGDGSCVANGTGYYCQCNEGSTNLFNLTTLACFKGCSFGADCSGLGLNLHSLPPPPPPSSNGTLGLAPPPPPSPPNGSEKMSKCSRSCDILNMLFLSSTIIGLVLHL